LQQVNAFCERTANELGLRIGQQQDNELWLSQKCLASKYNFPVNMVSASQVNDQHDDRNYGQEMDQTAANMADEAKG
jgi:hypothetical protein